MPSSSAMGGTGIMSEVSIAGPLVKESMAKATVVPQPEFIFESRINPQGKQVLHFPFMSVSDLHLGTRHFRASRTAHMLEHTEADKMVAVGDIIDHEYMREKPKWNFAPWHRQVLGHLLRKRAQYFPGNHDEDARGRAVIRNGKIKAFRSWVGKKVFGVSITNEDVKLDPKGRKIKIKHGDEYDDIVFGKSKSFFYWLGDTLHTPIANFDAFVQENMGFHRFSVAATAKKLVKVIINKGLGVEGEIMRRVDADPSIDGLLYGHSHMGGIKKTPAGKIILNDGCCTEHVQAMVHDKKGTYAFITWHKEGIEVEEENGSRYERSWKELGIGMGKEPTHIEDEFTRQADRLVRLSYRLAPPKDRQRVMKSRSKARNEGRVPPPMPDNIQLPPHSHREEQKQRREAKRPQLAKKAGQVAGVAM